MMSEFEEKIYWILIVLLGFQTFSLFVEFLHWTFSNGCCDNCKTEKQSDTTVQNIKKNKKKSTDSTKSASDSEESSYSTPADDSMDTEAEKNIIFEAMEKEILHDLSKLKKKYKKSSF